MNHAARLAIMLVPLLWSYPAMTEEGPKASAPLPPPLPAASPPAIKATPPGQATGEKGASPRLEFEQPKVGSPQSKSSVALPAARMARKKDAHHSRGRTDAQGVDLVGRPAPDSGERRRNPPIVPLKPGRLSPPPVLYPFLPPANGAMAWSEPPHPPLRSVPEYPWGPPVSGYGSYHPYGWPPASPAPFRSGY